MRNPIEQWSSRLKRRIRQFNIFFPTYNIKTTERWIKAWTALSRQSRHFGKSLFSPNLECVCNV